MNYDVIMIVFVIVVVLLAIRSFRRLSKPRQEIEHYPMANKQQALDKKKAKRKAERIARRKTRKNKR